MYELQYISARPNKPRLTGKNIQLESLISVRVIINSIIQESREFVNGVLMEKYLDETQFDQSPKASSGYYGDVDKPVATIDRMEDAIRAGEYKYRIGTSDPSLYNTIGVLEFRVVKMDS